VFGYDYDGEEYKYGEGEYIPAEEMIDWFDAIEGIWDEDDILEFLVNAYPDDKVIEFSGGKIVVSEPDDE
jgi:hypothetical protein